MTQIDELPEAGGIGKSSRRDAAALGEPERGRGDRARQVALGQMIGMVFVATKQATTEQAAVQTARPTIAPTPVPTSVRTPTPAPRTPSPTVKASPTR